MGAGSAPKRPAAGVMALRALSPGAVDERAALAVVADVEELARRAEAGHDIEHRRAIENGAETVDAVLRWAGAAPGGGAVLARVVAALVRTWQADGRLGDYGMWVERARRADVEGELRLRVRQAAALHTFAHHADYASAAQLPSQLRADALAMRAYGVYAAATVLWAATVFHVVSARDAADGLEDALKRIPQGDAELRALALARLGGLFYATGRHADGAARLGQARSLAHSRHLRRAEAFALVVLGEVARGAQNWSDAVRYLSGVVEIETGIGAPPTPTMCFNLANALWRLGRTTEAASWILKGLDAQAESRSRMSTECALLAATGVMLRAGSLQLAVRLLAAGDAAARSQWEPSDRPDFDACLAELGRRLPSGEFEREWQAGRALDLRDALCLVRSSLESPRSSATGEVRLSRREYEVLEMVVAGRLNRDIAEALVLSVRTVESHVASVCSKLGVRTRTQAVAEAIARGIVSPPPPSSPGPAPTIQ